MNMYLVALIIIVAGFPFCILRWCLICFFQGEGLNKEKIKRHALIEWTIGSIIIIMALLLVYTIPSLNR